MGGLAFKRGELDLAGAEWERARQLALARHWQSDLVYVNNWLAELALARNQWAEAGRLLDEGERLAQASSAAEPVPDLHRLRAELRLAQGQDGAALAAARQAVEAARAVGLFEGTAMRALAEAQWANGNREAAEASYELSLARLDGRNPYEAARTRLSWGRRLAAGGDEMRGAALLDQASRALEALRFTT